MAENTDEVYELRRLAEVVAEITSGVKGAIPERDDFDNAAWLYGKLEKRLSD